MGVVYIKGHDWVSLRQKLVDVGIATYEAQDNVVANVAALTRPKLFAVEKKYFNHGKEQSKWVDGEWRTRKTIWDSGLKGYVSSSDGRRLIQFNWENLASRNKRTGKLKKGVISQAYVYSLTANLWEANTKRYSKASPPFGNPSSPGYWGKGAIRKGFRYFERADAVASLQVPAAIKRTENNTRIWRKVND